MSKVLLQNLTKNFDNGVTAVNNVTLEVADKEFIVIVGPSGCGKTTLLRMIAGLEEPTSGIIAIGKRVVTDVYPKDRDIAMVFQNYALYPHMTVFENMAFGLRFRGFSKSEIKKRVENATRLLGIEQLLMKKPGALSGGQRQRVAVGRAIVCNPKVFLFDEPLSNLDAEARMTTRAELKALHHQMETTSIYVTHDQAEAMSLGDRIAVMYGGIIQQVGSPLEVYNQPLNKFIAGFLGMAPMNFFTGTVCYDIDKTHVTTGKNTFLLPARTRKALATYKNKQVVLGVRPEHVSLQPIGSRNQNTIAAIVTVVEPLGDCIAVYLKTSYGDRFIAKAGPHVDVHMNQKINIHINTERAHIFEPNQMGKNITLGT